MPFKRSTLRYAHTSGHAHCCYADNGEYVNIIICSTHLILLFLVILKCIAM